MTRQTRQRVAAILGILTGLVIFVPGMILAMVMQDKDHASQRAAWGQEMTCTIAGQENPLIVRLNRIQREVKVTCADNRPRSAMMLRTDSERSTTSVWYNSDTHENFIRYDLDTSFNSLSPGIWSNWPFIQIPFVIVALAAGLIVHAWIRTVRPRADTAVTSVTASS